MIKDLAGRRNQAGQTAVLFALMIIGIVVFVGLAVDGGSVFNGRRVAQNAADSAALTGVHYMVGSDAPTETRLQEVVNGVVEANDIPDTDGVSGNATNDNVSMFYTNERGNRLTTDGQPCDIVGTCGSIPTTARGLEVVIDHQVATYFLGVIDRDSLDVAADAVAVVTGGAGGTSGDNNVLVAFGACSADDMPLDISAKNVDFIGGLYSATWFENSDDGNHYHGQVTFGQGYGYTDSADVPGVYWPNPPGLPEARETNPGQDPLEGLFTVDDFNCTDGAIGGPAAVPPVICHDLAGPASTTPDGIIDTQLLKDQALLYDADPGPHEDWQLQSGIYYGGNYPFDFGEDEMKGNVTIVTSNYIKLTAQNSQLTGYLPPGTPLPGLLLFSALDVGQPCEQPENLTEEELPIDTTGSSASASARPEVWHSDDDPDCVDLDNPSSCYRFGGLTFKGIVYAPHGRVASSGDGAGFHGAIIAPSIRIRGSRNRTTGPTPDKVGSLYVVDPNLFPQTQQLISLER